METSMIVKTSSSCSVVFTRYVTLNRLSFQRSSLRLSPYHLVSIHRIGKRIWTISSTKFSEITLCLYTRLSEPLLRRALRMALSRLFHTLFTEMCHVPEVALGILGSSSTLFAHYRQPPECPSIICIIIKYDTMYIYIEAHTMFILAKRGPLVSISIVMYTNIYYPYTAVA